MNLAKVQKLNAAAHSLDSWVETLTFYVENPTAMPNRQATNFSSREEFIAHIGCMIGHYQDELNAAYNEIDEWVSK